MTELLFRMYPNKPPGQMPESRHKKDKSGIIVMLLCNSMGKIFYSYNIFDLLILLEGLSASFRLFFLKKYEKG